MANDQKPTKQFPSGPSGMSADMYKDSVPDQKFDQKFKGGKGGIISTEKVNASNSGDLKSPNTGPGPSGIG